MNKFEKMMEEWADSWEMIGKEDVDYGRRLVAVMKPFVIDLIDSGLSERTIKRHLDNLWMLGGEIIANVSTYDEYEVDPLEMLMGSLDEEGGMLCKHINSATEQASYDATCRKLYKFLESGE